MSEYIEHDKDHISVGIVEKKLYTFAEPPDEIRIWGRFVRWSLPVLFRGESVGIKFFRLRPECRMAVYGVGTDGHNGPFRDMVTANLIISQSPAAD